MYDNIILIDNNKVLVGKESKRAILCPSYEYHCPYDVLGLVDRRVIEAEFYGIASILSRYDLIEKDDKGFANYFAMLSAFYIEHASQLKMKSKSFQAHERQLRDKMWLTLGNALVALHSKKVGKEAIVKYINNKLNNAK